MTKRLLLIIFAFLSVKGWAQTSVIFSVQAHQDDWQLFMGSKIVADMNAGAKIVFITLTAGDASAGSGSYGPSGVPFYMGRENGSMYATKYMADIKTGATTPDVLPTATTASVNGHNITKYVYKGIVNYFFRLPDGNGNGTGFASTGNVSLERLRTGAISSISALGGLAATYTSWTDLTNTIKQIMTNEKVTGTQAWIYAAHTIDGSNSVYNPGDHSDHRYSSLAAQHAVASGMTWVGVAGFMNYASSSSGANLSNTDHENSTALFGLTAFGMVEAAYGTTFNSGHLGWLPMEYFQVIKSPSGNAPFAGPGFAGNEEIQAEPAGSMTKIPMTSAITAPALVNKDIKMMINPYETGALSTAVYDEGGNKIFEQRTDIINRDAVLITLKQPAAMKGTYVIKNILNNKYIESRTITVE
jgi:hypothetical protein